MQSTFHALALSYFAREPRLTTTKVSNIQLRAFSFQKSFKESSLYCTACFYSTD